MKTRRLTQVPQSTRLFTGREEERQVFWDAYQDVRHHLGEESEVTVLTYYGIGGIGKSALMKELRRELAETVPAPRCFFYDFASGTDTRPVLKKMRDHLFRAYKYEFPLFDLALYVYHKKTGTMPDREDPVGIIPDSPFLHSLLDVVQTIPTVGTAVSVTKAVSDIIAVARRKLAHRKNELWCLENEEPDFILEHLPAYFAIDLGDSLVKAGEPLVVFLDTYEALVNELAPVGEPLTNDLWLRRLEGGLVPNLPNVLWVIAGREKLKWDSLDPEAGWEQALRQHRLEDLSPTDTCAFLAAAGISNPVLQQEIYRLTHGTPVYLDLAVNNYEALVRKGVPPGIERIGEDKSDLVARYLRLLDPGSVELLYVLSCLEEWNEDLLGAVAKEVLPGISPRRLRQVKNYSFVSRGEDGQYRMHQTMKDALSSSPLNKMALAVQGPVAKYYHKQLQQILPSHPLFATLLRKYVHYRLFGMGSEQKFLAFYDREWPSWKKALADTYQYHELCLVLENLVAFTDRNFGASVAAAKCLADYGIALAGAGKYPEAIAASEGAYGILAQLYGETHHYTLPVLSNLAMHYSSQAQNLKALELGEKVYDGAKKAFGEKHPLTLAAMGNLADYYLKAGRQEEALVLNQKVLAWRQALLGEAHPDTLKAMSSLALHHYYAGRKQEAILLSEKILALKKRIFGADHLSTIDTVSDLATYYCETGRYEEAVTLGEKVVNFRQQFLGRDHPDTLGAMSNLSLYYHKAGRTEEALALGKQVLSLRSRVLDQDHPDLWASVLQLAQFHRDSGHPGGKVMKITVPGEDGETRELFAVLHKDEDQDTDTLLLIPGEGIEDPEM